jgi:predicted dinucleotide-binding enzyme
MNKIVGIIGPGTMGGAIALNFIDREVTVSSRSAGRAAQRRTVSGTVQKLFWESSEV